MVEVVAYVYEHLRDDPALNRLIAPGRISTTIADLTAPSSIALGGTLLAGFGIDWAEVGLAEDEQRELVEHLLRTLQTFVLDPGDPARTGEELRAYLSSAGSHRRCVPESARPNRPPQRPTTSCRRYDGSASHRRLGRRSLTADGLSQPDVTIS